MKSPLEQLSDLEEVIRMMHKIDSKLLMGQVILAHRELGRLFAIFERAKSILIEEEKAKQQKATPKIIYNGVTYTSLVEAMDATRLSRFLLLKNGKLLRNN